MKNFALLLFIFFFFQNQSDAQLQSGSFEFEGRIRKYDVYLPQNFRLNMPVVLNLHGYGWNTIDHANYTKMHEYADTSGFMVVYPLGSYASNGVSGWNNGLRDHPFGRTDTTSNDVGFISALIDTLTARYDINLSRVYCCGLSMGGEMTYRLSIELGHRFAAFASVAGKLNDVSGNLGEPIRSFPILHVHGTSDNVELYGPGGGNLWSVEKIKDFWVAKNGCLFQADTVMLPNLNTNDGCTVQKISFTNCSNEGCFIFYKILGGGHSWPSSADIGSPSWEGNKNMDINASVEILNFFKEYENPLTNVENKSPYQPDKFVLEQNYPNPFNPITKISWQLPVRSHQVLVVFDVLGREVETLVNEEREAGYHSINFDASDLSSGVYFYQLKTGEYLQTKKMISVK